MSDVVVKPTRVYEGNNNSTKLVVTVVSGKEYRKIGKADRKTHNPLSNSAKGTSVWQAMQNIVDENGKRVFSENDIYKIDKQLKKEKKKLADGKIDVTSAIQKAGLSDKLSQFQTEQATWVDDAMKSDKQVADQFISMSHTIDVPTEAAANEAVANPNEEILPTDTNVALTEEVQNVSDTIPEDTAKAEEAETYDDPLEDTNLYKIFAAATLTARNQEKFNNEDDNIFFKTYDLNKDGDIDLDEIAAGIKAIQQDNKKGIKKDKYHGKEKANNSEDAKYAYETLDQVGFYGWKSKKIQETRAQQVKDGERDAAKAARAMLNSLSSKDLKAYIKEAKELQEQVQAEQQRLQEEEAAANARAEAEAQAKAQAEAEAQAKAQAEAEAQAKAQAEAEAKAQAEAEAQAKAQAEAEAQAHPEAKEDAPNIENETAAQEATPATPPSENEVQAEANQPEKTPTTPPEEETLTISDEEKAAIDNEISYTAADNKKSQIQLAAPSELNIDTLKEPTPEMAIQQTQNSELIEPQTALEPNAYADATTFDEYKSINYNHTEFVDFSNRIGEEFHLTKDTTPEQAKEIINNILNIDYSKISKEELLNKYKQLKGLSGWISNNNSMLYGLIKELNTKIIPEFETNVRNFNLPQEKIDEIQNDIITHITANEEYLATKIEQLKEIAKVRDITFKSQRNPEKDVDDSQNVAYFCAEGINGLYEMLSDAIQKDDQSMIDECIGCLAEAKRSGYPITPKALTKEEIDTYYAPKIKAQQNEIISMITNNDKEFTSNEALNEFARQIMNSPAFKSLSEHNKAGRDISIKASRDPNHDVIVTPSLCPKENSSREVYNAEFVNKTYKNLSEAIKKGDKINAQFALTALMRMKQAGFPISPDKLRPEVIQEYGSSYKNFTDKDSVQFPRAKGSFNSGKNTPNRDKMNTGAIAGSLATGFNLATPQGKWFKTIQEPTANTFRTALYSITNKQQLDFANRMLQEYGNFTTNNPIEEMAEKLPDATRQEVYRHLSHIDPYFKKQYDILVKEKKSAQQQTTIKK